MAFNVSVQYNGGLLADIILLTQFYYRLLSFSANHDLALLNTFFSTAKNAISHTFNGRGKKRIDYILTRQRDRKLVRDVTVHPNRHSYLSRITTSSQRM